MFQTNKGFLRENICADSLTALGSNFKDQVKRTIQFERMSLMLGL